MTLGTEAIKTTLGMEASKKKLGTEVKSKSIQVVWPLTHTLYTEAFNKGPGTWNDSDLLSSGEDP